MAARLGGHAVARIDQDHGGVGGARAGHHVARVLLVAGRVRDDELAPRRREVAVGDVDRDALLALRDQAIGQQREIDRGVAVARGDTLERGKLIVRHGAGVVQQPADERALAVVDAACRGKPQQPRIITGRKRHQKYPARLRSSIEASEVRSSSRVAPRSLMRAVMISATTSSAVAAGDSTGKVHEISPTVRNRTSRVSTGSWSASSVVSTTGTSAPPRSATRRGWA